MFRVFLIICFFSLVWSDPCLDLRMVKAFNCAKNKPDKTQVFGYGPNKDDVKECKKEDASFDMFCIAKAKGYLAADGTIDRKALAVLIDKDYESNPQIAEKIKTNCIFADLSEAYNKLDVIMLNDLHKIERCIHGQLLLSMDNWNDEGECQGAKAVIEECAYAI